ncbi:MAG TPA: hypothetical protein ENN34_12270 [Deltaproteobacteria bacterium]|nr:hypothetical protein [Deltaproteobacteria bacterium]
MKWNFLYEYLKPPRGFHLTKSGTLFFVFLLGIIVSAMITGNNLLFLILACMLSFMIVSGIQSEMNLRHLEMERRLPAEIYARNPARIGYAIRNRHNTSLRLVISDFRKLKVPRLTRGSVEVVETDVVFQRRGAVTLGSVVVSTTFPYGLFEKSITFDLTEEIVVFPEPIEWSVPSRSGKVERGSGRATDSISHVRPYHRGDALSSIVWKKQHHGLISRVTEGGGERENLVVVLPGSDRELKIGRATYLVRELAATGQRFGLMVNSYFSGLATGRTHKIDILKQLAHLETLNQPDPRIVQEHGNDCTYL